MKLYLIKCAGHEYKALAPSACAAILQAQQQHNAHNASARYLRP